MRNNPFNPPDHHPAQKADQRPGRGSRRQKHGKVGKYPHGMDNVCRNAKLTHIMRHSPDYADAHHGKPAAPYADGHHKHTKGSPSQAVGNAEGIAK